MDNLYLPVSGDDAGNDLRWDNLVLLSELYLRNGNYEQLAVIREMQGDFCSKDGNYKAALPYYIMSFYCSLNGFTSIDSFISHRNTQFRNWKPSCEVSFRIINKIFSFLKVSGLGTTALDDLAHKAFVPGIFPMHLFSIDDSYKILRLAGQGDIQTINDMITKARDNLISEYQQPYILAV